MLAGSQWALEMPLIFFLRERKHQVRLVQVPHWLLLLCGCTWGLSYALVPKPGLANLSLLTLAKGQSTAGSPISLPSHFTCCRTTHQAWQ